MKHWLKKAKLNHEQVTNDRAAEVFGEVFNVNNDAPVRVRNVKDFVIEIIEDSQKKDVEIDQLKTKLEAAEAREEELAVARLALEQADLTRARLEDKNNQLQKKLDEQKQKNRRMRDENNDLKLKLAIRRKKVTRPGKEKE